MGIPSKVNGLKRRIQVIVLEKQNKQTKENDGAVYNKTNINQINVSRVYLGLRS